MGGSPIVVTLLLENISLKQVFMTAFSCPYCSEHLSEAERNDRTKTVFWFGRHGKRFAHTQCWLVDEVAARPTLEPAPEDGAVNRVSLRRDH
jgi:hypothetical protein